MAHSLSAQKRVRQNEKRRILNRARKSDLKGEVKGFGTALTAGKFDEAKAAMSKVSGLLQSVATKGVVHKNTAARRRSRMALRLNAAQKAPRAAGTK